MSNANVHKNHKNFTSSGDNEAEALLAGVLAEMQTALDGTGLCVVLGGSYGRGDGGVRQDRENGLLYNDLDFFVFARQKAENAESLLKELAEKYEKSLKVDVDFSRVMSIDDIVRSAPRLMMQELKRGYRLVCGEDLLAEYLPEFPAEKIPFSEACRLLLNRGMGLWMAGDKIAHNSLDTDFIMRNIYKAILGAGDAMLIADGEYRWLLSERQKAIAASDLPELWKEFYCEAVEFKRAPHRQQKVDMAEFCQKVREFFQTAILRCAQAPDADSLASSVYKRCTSAGEVSWKNLAKYCIKNRTLLLKNWHYYAIPTVAVLLKDLYAVLEKTPEKLDEQSKLYRQWLIFN